MTARLVLPLLQRRSPNLAEAGLVANVWLWVCEDVSRERQLGAYHRRLFRVDTGSTHSSMSMAAAREMNLSVPGRAVVMDVVTAVGRQALVVREGIVLAKFGGLEAHAFVVPCTFHEERPAEVPALLGLDAIRPRRGPPLRWTFDGSPTSEMPQGRLIIEVGPTVA